MTSRLMRRLDFRTPRVIAALVLREMSTTYGRSAGGYFWAIAEPVAGTVLLTAVFSFLAKSPPLGNNFALFYASGLVPFLMYSTVASKVAMAVKFSKPLLVYPRVTYLDAIIARFLLAALTQILVMYLLFTYLLMSSDTATVIDFDAIGLAILMAMALGVSIGTLNCLLFSVFPVWANLWSVLNRPLFLLSGVIFTYELLPESMAKVLWFNPLLHLTGKMREGFYPTYSPNYISLPYYAAWCFVPLVIGLFFLRRYHKKILNEL
ncbi:ABC transporter permease [Pseudoruegeria sp. SK021]|uniref:ABC transporter permease n=1 Tax=Pseudoruegeria sp. SK021 TaxID=1933035 RepID=UPI000A25CD3B|nr:ABC transporter permease [Pseudoruegeria sp. SK021]OSP56816.1 sugar ABC transporter permease [Pseudoruegeria sp. SK021]